MSDAAEQTQTTQAPAGDSAAVAGQPTGPSENQMASKAELLAAFREAATEAPAAETQPEKPP